VCSGFLYVPVVFTKNGLLVAGFFLFIIVSLIAALITYANRKDSLAYAIAAAPGIAFAIGVPIAEALS
jgi:hypothetical protein